MNTNEGSVICVSILASERRESGGQQEGRRRKRLKRKLTRRGWKKKSIGSFHIF